MINTMRVEEQFLYPLFFAFSPDMDDSYSAWLVVPSGDVYYYYSSGVDYSYGSPNTNWDDYVCLVNPFGGVDNGAHVPDSYGSPYTGGNYVVSMMIHPEGKLWSQAGYDSYGYGIPSLSEHV